MGGLLFLDTYGILDIENLLLSGVVMKKFTVFFALLCLLLCILSGCSHEQPQIVATTLPIYEFTSTICSGTNLQVGQLITENVSCLHDYTLKVSQMRMIESAEVIVINGAGLEDFLEDPLATSQQTIDSSTGCHTHDADHHAHEHDHIHTEDPHIWLSPENAKVMASNICIGLSDTYPEYADIFAANLSDIIADLDALQAYGEDVLRDLPCRELITFHDGFAYFAESFDLTILKAVEEESGSEASAQELKHLIMLVNDHHLPAVFTERNGSISAANVICAETNADVFQLNMAIAGESYFTAMYHNIDTIKEALG